VQVQVQVMMVPRVERTATAMLVVKEHSAIELDCLVAWAAALEESFSVLVLLVKGVHLGPNFLLWAGEEKEMISSSCLLSKMMDC
jgi:hypothetical protein